MLSLMQSPRRHPWLAGLALVTLLALGGCGGGASPTRSSTQRSGSATATTPAQPTASSPTPASGGWQTYTDSTYVFTIQYPAAWMEQVQAQPQNTPYEIVGFFPPASETNGQFPTQNVITITATTGQPSSVDGPPPAGFAPNGSVNVAGVNETLFSGPDPAGGQELLVMFASGTQLYLFTSKADTADAATFQQTFSQMLATFQVGSSYARA